MFGSQSMVGALKHVLVKHPRDSHVNQQTIDAQWQRLHYIDRPDYARVRTQYDAFLHLLAHSDAEISFVPFNQETGLDSIYVHDPLVIGQRGAILCNMGKAERRAEVDAVAACLQHIDVPVLGAIRGEGRLEGGDVMWVDERTVAVGEGYRTNAEGIRQLRMLLDADVDAVIPVPLPHWAGPDD